MIFIRASFSLASYVFLCKTKSVADTVQCYPYPTPQLQMAFPQITGQKCRKSQFSEVICCKRILSPTGKVLLQGSKGRLPMPFLWLQRNTVTWIVDTEESPLRPTWQGFHSTHRKLISAAVNKVLQFQAFNMN